MRCKQSLTGNSSIPCLGMHWFLQSPSGETPDSQLHLVLRTPFVSTARGQGITLEEGIGPSPSRELGLTCPCGIPAEPMGFAQLQRMLPISVSLLSVGSIYYIGSASHPRYPNIANTSRFRTDKRLYNSECGRINCKQRFRSPQPGPTGLPYRRRRV